MIEHLGFFTIYAPERTEETSPLLDRGVLFLRNSDGEDWYGVVAASEAGTYVAVRGDRIWSVTTDPSTMFPADCDVYRMPGAPLVELDWLWNDGSPAPAPLGLADYKAAFDAHLDAVAQQRQYDNRATPPLYATSTNAQWAAEAAAYVAWRDQALIYMFEQLSAVEAVEIAAPSIEDFIAGAPSIEWPASEPDA